MYVALAPDLRITALVEDALGRPGQLAVGNPIGEEI